MMKRYPTKLSVVGRSAAVGLAICVLVTSCGSDEDSSSTSDAASTEAADYDGGDHRL